MGWTGLSKKDFPARSVIDRTSPSRSLNRCTVNPLATITLSSHRLITSPIFRVFGQQTPIQLWRAHKTSVSTALGGNSVKTIQSRCRLQGRSCHLTKWPDSSGHQSSSRHLVTSTPLVLFWTRLRILYWL